MGKLLSTAALVTPLHAFGTLKVNAGMLPMPPRHTNVLDYSMSMTIVHDDHGIRKGPSAAHDRPCLKMILFMPSG